MTELINQSKHLNKLQKILFNHPDNDDCQCQKYSDILTVIQKVKKTK